MALSVAALPSLTDDGDDNVCLFLEECERRYILLYLLLEAGMAFEARGLEPASERESHLAVC